MFCGKGHTITPTGISPKFSPNTSISLVSSQSNGRSIFANSLRICTIQRH
jgi:hypothetical protein